MEYTKLIQTALDLGAYKAAIVNVTDISFDPSFRKLCEQNSCGKYGQSWMCPPYVGPIDELIIKAKKFRKALVYQIVDSLEDSYDFEGMMVSAHRINQLSQALRQKFKSVLPGTPLYLGAGACLLCKRCAKLDDKPCRFPELAMPSVESHGINVSKLASLSGMKYINGVNTVTYFGVVMFE